MTDEKESTKEYPFKLTPQWELGNVASQLRAGCELDKRMREYGATLLDFVRGQLDHLGVDSKRLRWLHSQESCALDADGYEWGIFRVKWEHGKPVSVRATFSDFSDLDAAIAAQERKGEG